MLLVTIDFLLQLHLINYVHVNFIVTVSVSVVNSHTGVYVHSTLIAVCVVGWDGT